MFINEIKEMYKVNREITEHGQLSDCMYSIRRAAEGGRDKVVLSKPINDNVIKSLKEKGFSVVVSYNRNEQITTISGWAK